MKIIIPLALLAIFSCAGKKTLEVSPIMLKIDGPMKNSDEEISGMDWYYDNMSTHCLTHCMHMYTYMS